jgi:hypothetical protein
MDANHVGALEPAQKAPISDDALEQRLRDIEAMQGKLHINVIRELKNILNSEKDPLEVIFESDLAQAGREGLDPRGDCTRRRGGLLHLRTRSWMVAGAGRVAKDVPPPE